jgi:hypothetical protein
MKEDGKHEDTPPVFGHGISGMEQAIRIVRFRIAKSDAPERGYEALDFILEELEKTKRRASYSIEELDKADKQLIKMGAQVAAYNTSALEGSEPHLTMETFQRLNEDNVELRNRLNVWETNYVYAEIVEKIERLERLLDAARYAVEWSRANALPGNPESIRRLDRILKEADGD